MKKYILLILSLSFFISSKLLASTILVSSIAELEKAIDNAKPGDIILLANGVYTTTTDITINKTGTAKQPITISAQSPSGAEIAGSGGFVLASPSSYIIIRDFKFTHAASK